MGRGQAKGRDRGKGKGHRDRSRSDSAERVLVESFLRIRSERRGGEAFRRRYKSACLRLLEFLLRLFDSWLSTPEVDPYHPSSRALLERRTQIQNQVTQCRLGNLPLRSQPLLPRLDRHSPGSE